MIESAVSDLPLPDSPTRHKRLAGSHAETDVNDRGHESSVLIEAGGQVGYLKQPGLGARARGSGASVPRSAMLRILRCLHRAPSPDPNPVSDIDFLVLAEDRAHRVGDLSHCRAGFDGANDRRHEIL